MEALKRRDFEALRTRSSCERKAIEHSRTPQLPRTPPPANDLYSPKSDSQARVAFARGLNDDTLRNLDDQVMETRQLRERINAAIRREYDAPYFPNAAITTNPANRIAAATNTGL